MALSISNSSLGSIDAFETTLSIDRIVEELVSPLCRDQKRNGLGNMKRAYMQRLSTITEMNETTGKNRDNFVSEFTPHMLFEPEPMVEVDAFAVRTRDTSFIDVEIDKKYL